MELAIFVASAVETSRPLMDPKGHHLEVELPEEQVVPRADPTRLAQFWIAEQHVLVEDNKVAGYRVNLHVTFILAE